jgi:hypothetical protein
MKFRFKVGDKVRLRSDLKELNRTDYVGGLIDDMKKYAGETVTIENTIVHDDKPCYYIEEHCYMWDERLFDGGQTIDTPTVQIAKVIFNKPATIVLWQDGTKTVVKCQKGEKYDKEKGLAMCIVKKALGNQGNYNNFFKKWVK